MARVRAHDEVHGHQFSHPPPSTRRSVPRKTDRHHLPHGQGKGVSFMENDPDWHGKAPTRDEAQRALAEIG
jgi:transketolase